MTGSRVWVAVWLLTWTLQTLAENRPSIGPFWDHFPLTLHKGWSEEALGPVWGNSQEDDARTWRISPLFAYANDPITEHNEFDFLYPLLTYDGFGSEHRTQLLQLFSFGGGETIEGEIKKRQTIFPIYFSQRSSNPANNYTAVLPFYGHMRNHLLRDEIRFALLPLWLQSRKKDVVTDNFLLPFFHLRHGTSLSGWQFWPLVGAQHKSLTWQTNAIDQVEPVGGHDLFFALWPFFIRDRMGLGTTNASRVDALLPIYSLSRSPERDNSTFLWPFITHTVDREKGFDEWGAPYPFIGWSRGPGKHANRFWPLYGKAKSPITEQDFLLWPFYTHKHVVSEPLDRERYRSLFYLYDDLKEENTVTGAKFHRRSLWPLFIWRHHLDGKERFQVLAPLEPIIPNNKSIERLYSPLWSIWRMEHDPKADATSRSFLWNLWRQDRLGNESHSSALLGAVQSWRRGSERQWKVFGMGKP